MKKSDPTIAVLAETFGRCLAACPPLTTLQEDDRLKRLRRIARIMDRLTRSPARRTWPARARKIYDELISVTHARARTTRMSLWATT